MILIMLYLGSNISLCPAGLQFTEAPASPEINMRGEVSPEQRQRHPSAPLVVPWHSGVLLPRGFQLTNGTW